MHKFKIICKKLKNKRKHGEGYIDTVVKIIACVLVGALVISGLAFLANNAMNTANIKVSELFKDYTYSGNYNLSGGGGAVLPGGEPAPAAGLYTDTSFKSWDDLVADGELTVSGDALTNASLSTNGKLIISSNMTKINEYAFCNCTSLVDIIIPNTVEYIGSGAFSRCTELTQVTIPDTITEITPYLFQGCTSLTNVKIPKNVATINYMAFDRCLSLSSIEVDEDNDNFCTVDGVVLNNDKTELVCCPSGIISTSYSIPNTVKTIQSGAFSNCKNLTNITIPNGVTNIGQYAFNDCTSLRSIVIPNSITNINSYAFIGCTSLTNVTIGTGINKISQSCFGNCSALKEIVIPDNVTEICENAFASCKSLKNITIPNSVTCIKKAAFVGCSALTNVHYQGYESQWSAISIENQNTYLTSANIDYIQEAGFNNLEDGSFKSWDDLIADGEIIVSDNVITGNVLSAHGELIVPDNIIGIGDGAFLSCDNLINITIPDTVTFIGGYVFEECNSIANIYFNGSASQWNEIEIGDYNDVLLCNITYLK